MLVCCRDQAYCDAIIHYVSELTETARAALIGFALMGFIGFFIKLVFIPINNILYELHFFNFRWFSALPPFFLLLCVHACVPTMLCVMQCACFRGRAVRTRDASASLWMFYFSSFFPLTVLLL